MTSKRDFAGALALSMVLAASAPSAAQQKVERTAKFALPYEKFVLSNGLEVILHEDHSDPIVAVATLIHVGSNREKPGKTGFAHFFEHMSFNDSENTPAGANRKLIPEWGGERNGGTWSDGTIYYEVVPKDAFDKILWIDSDRLGFMINTVTKEALEAEKQVVKNEKRERVDNVPYGYRNEIIRSNLYPASHPYSWTVIGSLPDLQAATLEDVREFYDVYYGAGNATLVIAGDIDVRETREKVKRWFGEIRKGPAVKPLKAMPVRLSAVRSVFLEDNFARLPELSIVYPTVENYHRDTYALQLLGELLAGSKKSPLYQVIVEEKKLAPGVSASQSSYEIAGEFEFRVRANVGTDLDDVNAAIKAALTRFETDGFSDSELQRVKAKQETSLYQGIGTVLSKAFRLASDNEFAGDPGHVVKAAQLMQAVNRDDVMRVYTQYIKGKNSVVASIVPKNQAALAVEGAVPATVWQEKIIAEVKDENVTRGEEANVPRTPTKHDRSEPPFGEAPLFRMPDIWETRLSNGMRVLGTHNTEIPLVTFDITIPGGHAYDPLDKAGTAALMAQLMNQGTVRRTPAELEEAIGLLGSSVAVVSTNEEVRIVANCLARNFEPTFAIVQEMLLEPRWDEAEYARLKQALETSLKGVEANAQAVASRSFSRLMYGKDHVFGVPAAGTLETAANITLDDLKQYYENHLRPAGAAIHVAGAIEESRVAKTLEILGSAWTKGGAAPPAAGRISSAPAGGVYFVDFPDARQSVIYAGRMAVSGTDPMSSRINFANEVLGGGPSGRLFQTLRIEKGYTYGAQSFMPQMREKAPLVIATSVRSNATLPSLRIIEEIVGRYGETFSEQDAAVTKNKVLKSNTLAYENLASKLNLLREMSKYGKSPKFVEEEQRELVGMSRDDFRAVIEKFMNERDMVYLIVGDKATQLEEVRKLKGTVTVLDSHGNAVEAP